jgi:hypothetical protein
MKVILGAALAVLGLWMVSSVPIMLDCNELSSSCPAAFGGLINEMSNKPPTTPVTGMEAEIGDYCRCFSSCLNYMTVYEKNQASVVGDAATTNCYVKSNAAGIQSPATNNVAGAGGGYTSPAVIPTVTAAPSVTVTPPVATPANRRLTMNTTRRLNMNKVPGFSQNTCVSCEQAKSNSGDVYRRFAGLAIVCGIALLITAGCEHMGMKWHSAGFSFCVLISDASASGLLMLGSILSMSVAAFAGAACDPDTAMQVFRDAGADNTDGNPDHAAAYANFLIKMLGPAVQGICGDQNKFYTYAVFTAIGGLSVFVGFLATCCVCLHCTDDGEGLHPDDDEANEMKSMMSGNETGHGGYPYA